MTQKPTSQRSNKIQIDLNHSYSPFSWIQSILESAKGISNDVVEQRSYKILIDLNHSYSPSSWIHSILESAKGISNDVVEQHLVGAKLERRFKGISISNHPAHAGDKQTERMGDFTVSKLVYHVTAAPSRNVFQKCVENLKENFQPILLVPSEQENKARILAQDEGIDKGLVIASIEDFIAFNIIELATEERKDFFSILAEIVEIYNRRLAEVETDLSLQIEVH